MEKNTEITRLKTIVVNSAEGQKKRRRTCTNEKFAAMQKELVAVQKMNKPERENECLHATIIDDR